MKKTLGIFVSFLLAAGTSYATSQSRFQQGVVVNGQISVGATPTPAASAAALDIQTTTKGFAGPRMTSAQRTAIASPFAGLQVYNTDTNKIEVYNGSAWATVGSSGGAKNYITYPDFEVNATTGWSLGHVAVAPTPNPLPTGVPTFGSGASGNLSIAAVGSNQLAGSYSLSYASSTATTVGDTLCTQAYTIDKEDQAKVLAFKYYYSAFSNPANDNWSGTGANSFGNAIYDVTNSAWIIPSGVWNIVQSSGTGISQGTFQTPSNMTSFRFCMFNGNASSGATTLYLDDFYVGPQSLAFGPAVTDWVAYTPTFTGFGTPTNVTFQSRRIGDSLEVRGYFTCGTTTAVTPYVTLGYNGISGNVTTDNTKAGQQSLAGSGASTKSSTTFFGIVPLISNNATDSKLTFGAQTSTAGGAALFNASTFLSSGDYVLFNALVPITGWSSNTQMSADTDTRSVAASYTNASGTPTIGTSDTQLTFDTKVDDSHSAFSSNTFTVPVSGRYKIHLQAFYNVTAFTANTQLITTIYRNGSGVSAARTPFITASGQFVTGFVSYENNFNAGDTIAFYSSKSGTGITANQHNDTTYNRVIIDRISGPAVVAASESVNATYTFVGATGIPNNSTTAISNTYATYTKVKDTHNAFSAGVYTFPVSGSYLACGSIAISTAWTAGNALYLYAVTAGSSVQGFRLGNNYIPSTSTQILPTNPGCFLYKVVAGDTLTINAFQNSGGAVALTSDGTFNSFSITRVGN